MFIPDSSSPGDDPELERFSGLLVNYAVIYNTRRSVATVFPTRFSPRLRGSGAFRSACQAMSGTGWQVNVYCARVSVLASGRPIGAGRAFFGFFEFK
jgi:hypothetical protein